MAAHFRASSLRPCQSSDAVLSTAARARSAQNIACCSTMPARAAVWAVLVRTWNVRYAKELVYADGIDLDNESAVVPVGVTCRLCEHLDCEQRAFPAMQHPLRIDENVRGVSFFAPVATRK